MTLIHAVIALLVIALAGCGDGDRDRAGDPDRSFGDDGAVRIDFGPTRYDRTSAVAVQPDGKLVIGLSSCDSTAPSCAFAMVRLQPNGELDESFGTDGRVLTPLGPTGEAEAHALALQPDGKIVLAGLARMDRSDTGQAAPALARYLPNGTLDPSFGDAGVVVTLAQDTPPDQLSGTYDALAIGSDGAIIACGTLFTPFSPFDSTIAVARYESDGTLDRTFGTNGFATPEIELITFASAVVIQPSGRIVVAGGNEGENANHTLILVGFDQEGRRDPSFGDAGLVTTRVGYLTFGQMLVAAPDGDLLAATTSDLLRYDADGRQAPSFHAALPDRFSIMDVTTDHEGRIIVVGSLPPLRDSADSYDVARLLSDGTIDNTFGQGGVTTTHIGFVTDQVVSHVALQSDGRIVVATLWPSERADVLVLRYLGGP